MHEISMHGMHFKLGGRPLSVGEQAPNFALTDIDLKDISLANIRQSKILLNIFPSLDTPTCAASIKAFNAEANNVSNALVLCVSADLPFAHKRFCGVHDLQNIISVSTFRAPDFGTDYGVTIIEGPLTGLLSRVIYVLGPNRKVEYCEFVADLGLEPNYGLAYKHLAS